jgi:hypothetical protein
MQKMTPFSPIPHTIPVENQYHEACNDENELSSSLVQQRSEQGNRHSNDQNCDRQSARWEPGHWRQFPFLSMFSLLAVLVCTKFLQT